MSIAKASVLDMMNNVPDDIQDEIEVLESLYKLIRLEKSRISAKENGTMSTDEVRAHFANKHQESCALVW